MKLDFIMLADAARIDDEHKVWIEGGALTHVRASSVPFTLPSLTIVMRFFLEPGDRNVERPVEFRILHPDETSTDVLNSTIPAAGHGGEITEGHPDEDETLIVVGRITNILFPAAGRYEFAIYLDGDLLVQRGVVLIVG